MLINIPYHRANLERAVENYKKMRAEHLAGTAPPDDSVMTKIRQWQNRKK